MSTVTNNPYIAHAINITCTDDTLTVTLQDGRTISVPLTWYPRLVAGTPLERQHWRLMGNGIGIHWADLDEDIKVEHLLMGKASTERPEAIEAWLKQREARGRVEGA